MQTVLNNFIKVEKKKQLSYQHGLVLKGKKIPRQEIFTDFSTDFSLISMEFPNETGSKTGGIEVPTLQKTKFSHFFYIQEQPDSLEKFTHIQINATPHQCLL